MLRRRVRSTLLAVVLVMALPGLATASGVFVEPDVVVLQTQVGTSSPDDSFGWAGAELGDLDGDGVGDYAVTAITDPDGGFFAGKAYVYSGAHGSVLNTINGLEGELMGWSIDTAGDVDADGTPDYVIGAPGFGPATPTALGRALVLSGSDHTVIHEFTPDGRTRMGTAVAGAGDVDDDGHVDVIVGSENAGSTRELAGRVTLYSGATGDDLWTTEGKHAWDLLGSAADDVGDVNGDGILDVVVGARGVSGHNGRAAGLSGRGVAYVLSGLDGDIIHTLRPTGDTVQFARFFARGGEDYDGDGVGDIFVADYAAGRGGKKDPIDDRGRDTVPPVNATGSAYVYSGATGKILLKIDGSMTGEGLGPGRPIDDVDGDGTPDLLIAAWTSSEGAPAAGLTRVHSGEDGSILRTITSATAGENLGIDALGIGDVDEDGNGDYLLTGFGIAYVLAGP
jgi:hypothetical protein